MPDFTISTTNAAINKFLALTPLKGTTITITPGQTLSVAVDLPIGPTTPPDPVGTALLTVTADITVTA